MHPYESHVHFAESLNAEVVSLARYVQFDKRNLKVFSLENARIMISTCIEIEALLKQICESKAPKCKAENMTDYLKIADSHFPEIFTSTAGSGRYELSFSPWLAFLPKKKKSPLWWQAHQKVKHQRHLSLSEASLENVLNAIAAHEITLLIYYSKLVMWQRDEFPFTYKSDRTLFAQINWPAVIGV
jgi:hypothetical protein